MFATKASINHRRILMLQRLLVREESVNISKEGKENNSTGGKCNRNTDLQNKNDKTSVGTAQPKSKSEIITKSNDKNSVRQLRGKNNTSTFKLRDKKLRKDNA